MGANARIIHFPDDCPYDEYYYRRKYYVSTNVNGPSLLCGSTAYSVANISGGTYSWSCSSNLTISGSGHSISVTPNLTLGNSGWVEVNMYSPCGGTVTTRKNVLLRTDNIEGPYTICTNTAGNTLSVPAVTGATAYNWSIYPSTGASISSYNSNYADVTAYTAGSYSVTLSITTPMGVCLAPERALYAVDNFPPGNCDQLLAVFPNPANDELNIVYNPEKLTEASEITFSASLLDGQGRSLLKADNSKGTPFVKLDTKNVPSGTYFLQISGPEEIVKRQVIIQH